MPPISRLTMARADILAFFKERGDSIYSREQIAKILAEQRDYWRLAKRTGTKEFIEFLKDKGQLVEHHFFAEAYRKHATRYSWGTVTHYQLAQSLRQDAYLSHGSAMFLHGLSDWIPTAIYVNREQSPKYPSYSELTQKALDMAFGRTQRLSKLVYETQDAPRMVILSGKHTRRLDVEPIEGPSGEALETTSIERTLIDIVVRPAYAGGIVQVLAAYEGARERVSVNRMRGLLEKLDYLYPYHQAIGFLMERAGYEPERVEMMHALGTEFDFYLAHGLKEKAFDEKWRLHIPVGF